MAPRIVSLFALALPLTALACAVVREPNAVPPTTPSKAEKPKEQPLVEMPAKDESSGETPREGTFASCAQNACATGSVCIEHHDKAGSECVPLALQKSLEKPENWDHPIVIQNPVLGSFDRKLTCKTKSCVYPGSMLVLSETHFIPIGLRWDDAVTHHYLSCAPGTSNRPGCSDYPTSRLLGIIHPITVPGQSGTLLTFELLGVESSSESSDAR